MEYSTSYSRHRCKTNISQQPVNSIIIVILFLARNVVYSYFLKWKNITISFNFTLIKQMINSITFHRFFASQKHKNGFLLMMEILDNKILNTFKNI